MAAPSPFFFYIYMKHNVGKGQERKTNGIGEKLYYYQATGFVHSENILCKTVLCTKIGEFFPVVYCYFYYCAMMHLSISLHVECEWDMEYWHNM